jgi:predicted transcriptional regulator with HTH domain
MREEELLKSYFTEQDIKGLTIEEFQVAMLGLIEKGLMEMIEKDGMKFYRPTPLARKMKSHLNSNPKTQN